MGKEILIRVDNKGIHFNEQICLPLSKTNLNFPGLLFNTRFPIYWKVEMIQYEAAGACLTIKVKSYKANGVVEFGAQKPKKPIEQLVFEKLEWKEFEPFLSSYKKSELKDVIIDNTITEMKNTGSHKLSNDLLTNFHLKEPEIKHAEPKNEKTNPTFDEYVTIPFSFEVSFNEVKIQNGFASCKKTLAGFREPVIIQIPNEHLLVEFDLIKAWFAKKLGTRKIDISGKVTTKQGLPETLIAQSHTLARINDSLIESVKYLRTQMASRPLSQNDPDKSLFSGDEVFGLMEGNVEHGNVFNQSESDILEHFIDDPSIRNRKQLLYIAGKLQTGHQKLKFTLHPLFGFLFCLEGEQCHHFVWELLNSHATYIWSIGKSNGTIQEQFKRIEIIMNTIRDSGRESYKRAYRQHVYDADILFHSIIHRDASSDFIDGFVRWRQKLSERLV